MYKSGQFEPQKRISVLFEVLNTKSSVCPQLNSRELGESKG